PASFHGVGSEQCSAALRPTQSKAKHEQASSGATMTSNASLEYGQVRADEIDGLNSLLEQALTFAIGGMAPWTEAIGHAHMRAVRRSGRTVAGIGVIPMGHYFGGQSVPAGGITAVGVAPDQRGSGVGLWMIQRSLEELHSQGVPLATLYRATTTFYRRAGLERA